MFQHTAARRRLALSLLVRHGNITVSTHSRPKAAGRFYKRCSLSKPCFNTQPPEGGWKIKGFGTAVLQSFNTQPPEGGWMMCFLIEYTALVSTHSRPKAAGRLRKRQATWRQSFNTQPPEGGWFVGLGSILIGFMFQHTAARRRLAQQSQLLPHPIHVSTHSRPKAAGNDMKPIFQRRKSFNTQPPEGGWVFCGCSLEESQVSTHSRPKAAGLLPLCCRWSLCRFNTQPPEGGWFIPEHFQDVCFRVSTHSRPKAAGRNIQVFLIVS